MARRLLAGVWSAGRVGGIVAAIGCTTIASPGNANVRDPNRIASLPYSDVTASVHGRWIENAGDRQSARRQGSQDGLILAQNNATPYPAFPQQLLMQQQQQWNQAPRPQPSQQQQPAWGQQTQQQPQPRQQSAQGAQAERAFRNALTMQGIAGGFGGIFGPGLKKWVNTPSAPSSGGGSRCSGYSEYAAQQACKSGHGWEADRLQNHESDGAERDWYNR